MPSPSTYSKLASFIFYCLLLSISSINALPLVARQSQPTFLQTVQMTDTPAGLMTETCVITLAPITDVNGQPAVEEVRTCTITMDSSGNAPPPISSPDLPPDTSNPTDTATTPPASETAPPADTPSDSTTITADPTDTNSSPAETTSVAGDATISAIIVNPISTVLAPSSTEVSPVDTSTSVATDAPPAGGQISVIGFSSVTETATDTNVPGNTTPQPVATQTTPASDVPPGSSSSAATGSAEASEASSSDGAEFSLPGKQLSVLPIGLGVFAGISVIALIVVGLVTYERTKYRKAFRQRKLAESGAGMGYGGNAQGS